ncbi:hypothetical protein OSJ57_01490 [Sphingomonas sp. HH69]
MSYLHTLLSREKIEAVERAPLYAGDRHPAWSALFLQQASPTDLLTRDAADMLARLPDLRDAMRKTIERAADLENVPDAAAALAELRAFGSMIEAGIDVRPINAGGQHGATPDFIVDAGDGPVTVEVHAKHEAGPQTELRQAAADGKDVPGVERSSHDNGSHRVTFTTTVLHPGGAPDPENPFDSVQANVISKLCRVKSEETQRREGVPSVLWLDLSHFGVMTHTLLEQTIPLVSGNIGLTSGAIWHAFYGWKGAPILEEGNRKRVNMGHDGRFRLSGTKKSPLAAVIVCFESGLVLFENPWADIRLPHTFRRRCERLPWFKIGHSFADWSPGETEMLVGLAQKRITALAAERHV